MRLADEAAREEAVSTFPEIVQKAWRAWMNGKR